MKKFIFCFAAVLMLAACNNRSENQENGGPIGPQQPEQSEMQVASPREKGQDEWIQQTTIMSDKPMVIDFYATWCGPCKQMAPIIDVIEHNHKGEVIFKRVDVDKEPELAQEFNIEAIPTLMFVTPKGEYQTLMGLQPAETIELKIAEMLRYSAK
jgi:thioredoxin